MEELYYCALCLREIGREKEAEQVFDEILEHAGRSLLDRPDATKETIGYCHYYLGVAREGKGDVGRATEYLRTCVKAFEEGGFTTNPLYDQAKARLDELEQ